MHYDFDWQNIQKVINIVELTVKKNKMAKMLYLLSQLLNTK